MLAAGFKGSIALGVASLLSIDILANFKLVAWCPEGSRAYTTMDSCIWLLISRLIPCLPAQCTAVGAVTDSDSYYCTGSMH
jgi:hypothetical protein